MRLSQYIKNKEISERLVQPKKPSRPHVEGPAPAHTAANEREARERARLEEENEKIRREMEDLRKKNETLEKKGEGLDSIRQEMAAASRDMIQNLQEKMAQMDREWKTREDRLRGDLEAGHRQTVDRLKQEIGERDQKLGELARGKAAIDSQIKEIEAKIRSEAGTASREAIEKLEGELRAKEEKLKELQSAPPPAQKAKKDEEPWKEPLPVEPPKALFRPGPHVEAPAHSPEEEEAAFKEAQAVYNALVGAGERVFTQVKKKETLDFPQCSATLLRMVDYMQRHDEHMLSILTGPYPLPDYFSYHAANCATLAVLLGIDMKLSRTELEELAVAAFFHDVGLVGIHESLDYPGQLSESTKAEVAKHPEQSALMMEAWLQGGALSGILQHHELGNGRGYPQGLKEEDIHLYAKIINVVDAFEAMTHERPYRPKPLEVSQAIKELIEKERGLYDKSVLKSLLTRLGLYPVQSQVELSNRQIARVLRQNRSFPLSPVVQIEYDETGAKLRHPPIIDLTKNQLIHIIGPLQPAPTFAKERQEEQKKIHQVAHRRITWIREVVPFVLILAGLAFLILLILKI